MLQSPNRTLWSEANSANLAVILFSRSSDASGRRYRPKTAHNWEKIRACTMTYLPSGSSATSRSLKGRDLFTRTLTPLAKLE